MRYIFVRIGEAHEAEDLASEVFVRALRSVGTFQDTGIPMEAWIFKIAHNIVVDHLRKRSRRPASVPIDEAFGLAGKSDPAKEVERLQAIESVRTAMCELTESQRRVLELRFTGELSSEEVAVVLGKKPGAIREMQSAAVKKLRTILSKDRAPAPRR